MRVLHIQKVAGIAGSENHLLTLLPRLQAHGYMPEMLALADRHDHPEPFAERVRAAGVPVGVMPLAGDLDLGLVRRLERFIRAGGYSVVHTHLLHADLHGVMAARRADVKTLVSTRHNDDAFRRFLPLRWVNSWSARQIDHLICISESVRGFVVRTELVPERKTSVIHYGLSVGDRIGDRSWRAQMGWSDGTPVVGIVARLTAQKGHSSLLKAMPEVLKRVPEARLIIVGEGELRANLVDLSRRLGVQKRVHFFGYRADAASLMAGFDLFVHPSRWEGFGLVFLEAMAARRAIVATRVGSIPEIVAQGETGLLVPVDDVPALAGAMVKLLISRADAQKMGEAGRIRLLQEFTVEAMVSRTAAIYDHLVRRT